MVVAVWCLLTDHFGQYVEVKFVLLFPDSFGIGRVLFLIAIGPPPAIPGIVALVVAAPQGNAGMVA